MKNIIFIFMILNVQSFSQISDLNLKNFDSFKSFKCRELNIGSMNFNNDLFSSKTKLSYVFIQQGLKNNKIDLSLIQNRKCPDGQGLFVLVPLVSIYTSYLAYDGFKSGNINDGYVFTGISAGLIIIPISIMWYCAKH